MSRDAARMGKWLLSAAPVTVAAFRLFSAGGAGLALYLWAALGSALPSRDRYPYVRKPRRGPHLLFLACSAGWLAMTCAEALLGALRPGVPPTARLAAQAGAVFFALSLAAPLLRLRVPRRAAWSMGGLFCLGAAYAAWLL